MRRKALPDPPVIQTKTRILGHVFLARERRWGVRLRCPDGVVRQFTTDYIYASPEPGRRRKLPQSTRFAVLQRDAFTCRYCGRSAPEVALHVDHVVPVVAGGSDEMDNLVTACQDCNLGKSDSAA